MGGTDNALASVSKLGNQIQDFNIGAVPNMAATALITGKNPFDQHARAPQPYADDLVKYAPKTKFIFKVLFTFVQPYAGNFKVREFNFLVKQIDKPKVKFVYEDVNFYNYRTKVLKQITYDPLTLVFIDDIQNTVVDFFEYYRRAHSPITWMPFTGADPKLLEQSGMNFQPGRARGLKPGYAAGVGTLEGVSDGKTTVQPRFLLKNIKLVQYYAHGTRHNVYFFMNPRINSMEFEGQADHAQGTDGHGLSVSFDYDYLTIEDFMSFTNDYPFGQYDILGGGGIQSPLLNSIVNNTFGYPDETLGSARNVLSPNPGGFDFSNLTQNIGAGFTNASGLGSFGAATNSIVANGTSAVGKLFS
jgi:hypothetical protein